MTFRCYTVNYDLLFLSLSQFPPPLSLVTPFAYDPLFLVYSYEIMRHCWQFDPKLRPSFHELITILEQFLADYRVESPVSISEKTHNSDTSKASPPKHVCCLSASNMLVFSNRLLKVLA